MTTGHAHFELLCLLAELDQLSPAETIEFREHYQGCAGCRQHLLELAKLHATMIVTNSLSDSLCRSPRGMNWRFIARANREGVPLSRQRSGFASANLIVAGALVVLLVAAAVVGSNHIALPRANASQPGPVQSLPADTATLDHPDDVMKPAWRVPRSVRGHRRVAPQSQSAETLPALSSLSPQLIGGDVVLVFKEAEWHDSSVISSRLRFAVPREFVAREPGLVTACVCAPLAPLVSRTNFTLASAQLFDLGSQAYRRGLMPEFRPDLASFQFIDSIHQ